MNKEVYLFIFVTFLLFFSCGKEKQDNKIKLKGKEVYKKSKDISFKDKEVLNFGITPWQTVEEHRKGFLPILNYLGKKLNKKIILNVAVDYKSLKRELKNGNVDIASFSPFAYVDALNSISDYMKYIATLTKNRDGKLSSHYFGYIFSHRDNNINSLKDLKNKSFAFVDKKSTSGYVFPMLMFNRNNIKPEKYFSNIYFLGTHSKVISAVVNKQVYAGATWDGSFNIGVKKYGNIFDIIKKSRPIPYDAWVANKDISDTFINNLRNELVKLNENTKNEDGKKILSSNYFPYSGFTVKSKTYYQVVKEASELIN